MFYAVAAGRNTGIFTTWAECKDSVNGFKGAKYKKFATVAEAEEFIAAFGSQVAAAATTEENAPAREPDFYVYTDGACANNGKPNAVAGIGIFFGDGDPRNVSAKLAAYEKQTNNVAELTAILRTWDIIKDDVSKGQCIGVVTDSEYAIKCMTTYGAKCAAKNWAADIPNRELVRLTYESYQEARESGNVVFIHVRAHTGRADDAHSVGNNGADKLANLAAFGTYSCPYSAAARPMQKH